MLGVLDAGASASLGALESFSIADDVVPIASESSAVVPRLAPFASSADEL
jgi:hypothetical protein